MAFETARHLYLLFLAGQTRFAIQATSVVEVSPPDFDGASIRGFLELADLSELLGGAHEQRPGIGIVLDVSPTFAVRARQVLEVVDVAGDRHFRLPRRASAVLGKAVRGAIMHGGRLYLELVPEALPPGRAALVPVHVPVYPLEEAPDRALIVESGGKTFGLPLSLVAQVAPVSDGFMRCPRLDGPLVGVLAAGETLWPVFSLPGLLGGQGEPEGFMVLGEVAGEPFAVAASRVLGVRERLARTPERGHFSWGLSEGTALFLDLQRMFS